MAATHFVQVESAEALRRSITSEPALLAYFTTADCNVCRVLKPKISALLEQDFPRLMAVHVDCAQHPEVGTSFSVFAVPTIVVFFDGREWLREGRYLSLQEFRHALTRPYELIFGNG